MIFRTKDNELAIKIKEHIEKEILNANNNKAVVTNELSKADELKKFKELLDLDIITQEEFDIKKKELLGI